MNTETIRLKVTTFSNLFIGGSPTTFEIGGVDLFTVTNHLGKPYIPGSSFKGTLRNIVRDLGQSGSSVSAQAKAISQAYKQYLLELQQQNMVQLEQMKMNEKEGGEERINRMNERFTKEIGRVSAECLFGMEGFNHTPKLIFNDLRLLNALDEADIFSIDSKNSIEQSEKEPKVSANPRTYKTVRPGVEFAGEINFHMMDKLSVSPDVVRSFVEHAVTQFNEGAYRLGNSGSRGYGRIQVEILRECEQSG